MSSSWAELRICFPSRTLVEVCKSWEAEVTIGGANLKFFRNSSAIANLYGKVLEWFSGSSRAQRAQFLKSQFLSIFVDFWPNLNFCITGNITENDSLTLKTPKSFQAKIFFWHFEKNSNFFLGLIKFQKNVGTFYPIGLSFGTFVDYWYVNIHAK